MQGTTLGGPSPSFIALGGPSSPRQGSSSGAKKKRKNKKKKKPAGSSTPLKPTEVYKQNIADEDSYSSSDEDSVTDGEDEGKSGYKKGGYHPVKVGDVYKGQYTILEKLGWGHFSTVWLCHDSKSNDVVALKIVKSAKHYTEAALDEIKILKRIKEGDPHNRMCCVHLLDSFEHRGPHGKHICMVFEVLGSNLLDLIKRYKYRGIPLHIVKSISKQVLIGLDYIHTQCEVIHTDLKPENILLHYILPKPGKRKDSGTHTQTTSATEAAASAGSEEEEPVERVRGEDDKGTRWEHRLDEQQSSKKQQHYSSSPAASSSDRTKNKNSKDNRSEREEEDDDEEEDEEEEVEEESEEEGRDPMQGVQSSSKPKQSSSSTPNTSSSSSSRPATTVSITLSSTPSSSVSPASAAYSTPHSTPFSPSSVPPPHSPSSASQTVGPHPPHKHSTAPPVLLRSRVKDIDEENPTDWQVKIADFGNACWTFEHFTNDIQTRQYRSPEVIVGGKWGPSCDMWSMACIVFELLTGDLLFEPKSGKTFDKNDDHLAQMCELVGRVPRSISMGGKYSRDFFTRKGELRNIKKLNYWNLEDVLVEKYKWNRQTAREAADFMSPMLDFHPERRNTAAEMLRHPWLRGVHPLLPGEAELDRIEREIHRENANGGGGGGRGDRSPERPSGSPGFSERDSESRERDRDRDEY